jgi:hypothetical protein
MINQFNKSLFEPNEIIILLSYLNYCLWLFEIILLKCASFYQRTNSFFETLHKSFKIWISPSKQLNVFIWRHKDRFSVQINEYHCEWNSSCFFCNDRTSIQNSFRSFWIYIWAETFILSRSLILLFCISQTFLCFWSNKKRIKNFFIFQQ